MKIHRCDRCGKDIDHRNKVHIKEWDNTYDKLDLCCDCLDEFYHFITLFMEKKEENDNE